MPRDSETEPTDPEPLPGSGVTRRRFLQGAAGAVVLGGAGLGVSQLVSSPSPPPALPALRFRSRPDLSPPPIEVLLPARGTERGLVMLTAARTDHYQHGPMIVDDAGDLVWFHPQERGSTSLQVQLYQGRPVLTWWQGRIVLPGGYGAGDYVIAGSDYRPLTHVRAGNGLHGDLHEFVITPKGTALFTIYHPKRMDLSAVGGPRSGTLLDSLFQEVDIETGRVLLQWSAAAHVGIEESYQKLPAKAGDPYDFFHINAIAVDGDGNLLISGRHTWAVYKVDRSTGTVIWRLGGKRSDFDIEPSARFAFQHDAQPYPGGILTVFDNGAGDFEAARHSRGLKLGVDSASKRVRLIDQYLPHPLVLASSQGSMRLLANGNAFIGWGAEPYFAEYGPNAGVRFDAKMLGGSNSYRAFRSAWTGKPATSPDLAVRRLHPHRVELYASWNGATEVAHWEVIAGDHADALSHTLGLFPRTGFETAIGVATARPYLGVQARDAGGRVLARSRAVLAARSVSG